MKEDKWPRESLEFLDKCPICGEPARELLYKDLSDRIWFCAPGVWTLYSCCGCGSAYLDPRPTPDSMGLAYRHYYTQKKLSTMADIPLTKLARWRRALRNGYLNARYGCSYAHASALGAYIMPLLPLLKARADRWIRSLYRLSQFALLLDVGCGNGEFLAEMKSAGWSVQGLEPDPESASHAERAGLSVKLGTLAENLFPDNHFDAITLSHVIEHMHNPLRALLICFCILRPGGILWIGTPNLASQGHALFGRNWLQLDPPRHLVLFTPDSLKQVVDRTGFEILPNPPGDQMAEHVFRTSSAIAQGRDPMNNPPLLPIGLKWKARLAELRSWWCPQAGEELVLLAKKPGPSCSLEGHPD